MHLGGKTAYELPAARPLDLDGKRRADRAGRS